MQERVVMNKKAIGLFSLAPGQHDSTSFTTMYSCFCIAETDEKLTQCVYMISDEAAFEGPIVVNLKKDCEYEHFIFSDSVKQLMANK